MFAFSHKEFLQDKKTSVLRSAVDAFNIFDLFIEVWRNMKWLFLAVILRRPYIRRAEDGKFDIFDAMNGKREVAAYGNSEAYAMLDVPSSDRAPEYSSNLEEENGSGIPTSLLPGHQKPARYDDFKVAELEDEESLSRDRTPNRTPNPQQEYSNTYGQDKL